MSVSVLLSLNHSIINHDDDQWLLVLCQAQRQSQTSSSLKVKQTNSVKVSNSKSNCQSQTKNVKLKEKVKLKVKLWTVSLFAPSVQLQFNTHYSIIANHSITIQSSAVIHHLVTRTTQSVEHQFNQSFNGCPLYSVG